MAWLPAVATFLGIVLPLLVVFYRELWKIRHSVNGHATAQAERIEQLHAIVAGLVKGNVSRRRRAGDPPSKSG